MLSFCFPASMVSDRMSAIILIYSLLYIRIVASHKLLSVFYVFGFWRFDYDVRFSLILSYSVCWAFDVETNVFLQIWEVFSSISSDIHSAPSFLHPPLFSFPPLLHVWFCSVGLWPCTFFFLYLNWLMLFNPFSGLVILFSASSNLLLSFSSEYFNFIYYIFQLQDLKNIFDILYLMNIVFILDSLLDFSLVLWIYLK